MGKKHHSCRESSLLPRDQGAEVMESLFHQKAPGEHNSALRGTTRGPGISSGLVGQGAFLGKGWTVPTTSSNVTVLP